MKSFIRHLQYAFLILILSSVAVTAFAQAAADTNRCAHPNKPPVVNITNPVAGNPYNAGSNINFDVAASDADGSITKVEFFNNGNKIGTDSTAPYRFTATTVEAGNYVLTAKATDNSGESTVSCTVKVTVAGCTCSGNIAAEGYTNIPGASVAELTSSPAFPNSPSVTASLNQFEYENVGNAYGVRVRGYICAPLTGEYTFYISGDDQVELWLSTDANPAHKVLRASILSWTNPKQYDKFSSQKSVPVRLVKGVRYYIETLHKQYNTYNHLSVAWTLPGGVFESPVKGSHLAPWINPVNSGARSSSNFSSAMEERNVENNTNEKLSLTAFPNPFQNYINLNTRSSDVKPLTITISDARGRVVEKKSNLPANGTLQLGNQLSSGIYFLEVIQGDKKERLKFLKQ